MKQNPTQLVWHAAGVALIAAMLIGVWWLGLKPNAEAAERVTQHQQAALAQQEAALRLAREVDTLNSAIASEQSGMLQSMPVQGTLADQNRQLDRMIRLFAHYEATIASLEPGQPVAGPEYYRVPIKVRGKVPFHGFVRLLKALHADARDTRIDAFDLTGSDSRDGLAGFEMTLTWHALRNRN